MNKNRCSSVYSFLATAVMTAAVVGLSSSAMADVVERYNAAGDLTASGTEVGAVQQSADNGGPAAGDVIKISGTATQAVSYGNPATSFTIQSATPGVKQTINAGTTRFYNFNDGAKTYNVTLKDLDYQGNEAIVTNCIGVFFHSSPSITMNLTLDNVTFTGFKEKEYTGAVFGFDSGTLNINASNGVVFDGNRAEGTGSGEYRGGAINVSQSGSLTINVADNDVITFRNNYATTCGSAINVGQKNTQIPATINGNSLFESNSSGKWGGAVHVWGNLTFNGDTTFTNNKGTGSDGGGIRQEGDGKYTIKFNGDVTMTGNTAPAAAGGAICSNGITMESGSINFTNNSAKTYGGAIRVTTGDLSMKANSITFDGNHVSGNDGGALQISGNVSITGTGVNPVVTFNKNYSAYYGGAINCKALTLTTGTFNFTNNYDTASSNKYSYGGAVYCTSISADAKKINFDSNSSKYYGGGLAVNGAGTIKADTIIFNKNSSANRGGAIFTNNDLTITGDTIKFTDNTANNFGGAIFNNNASSTLTITGKDVLFSGNHISANDGGTIYGGNVTLNGADADSVFTFDKNYTKYFGAAISTNALTMNTGTFNFTGNYETASDSRYSYGGAIHCTSISTNAAEIKFDSNTSRYYGGGISVSGSGGTIQADTITFNKNKADLFGGAIHLNGGTLTVKGDDVKFTDNSVTSANGDGGAIRGVNSAAVVFTGLDEESAMLFSGNTSTRYGGALSVSYITMSTGSFTFENNSTGSLGGAMYAATVTFSGDGTVGTFTGNAAEVGNDIYFFDANSVLTFQNAGTYSFDGGIYMDSETAQTLINQAQVTIAGREGDDTNVYQLQNVSISNSGKLTAELDYINSATGTFTLDDSSVLEFKTDSADAKRFDNTIAGSGTLLKTGEGVLALDGTEEHPITASSLTAEGGSLLFKGFYTGDLTIKDGALFSPGNSVGTLTMDGDFTAESGSTLLFEQDETGIDQLIILSGGTIDIADDAILELALTNPVPGATYTLIDSPDGLTGDYASDDFWNGLLSPESAYAWNLYVDGGFLYASIDANAVPEPSTWALLVLSAMGLLYWRKKN
ncbi:MAG: PEP-CTERM sorting domain-containing protein [Thermoguttaceae bacterium]|nr:PEP-CTERM sorting domain-containing protein [Thermoguttaceae bacterium]